MIRNLELQRVQTWTLVSLQPIHRAIIIRAAERMRMKVSLPNASAPAIRWTTIDIASDLSLGRVAQTTMESSVLIIDREAFLKHLASFYPSIRTRIKNSIQLLWSWEGHRNDDLSWCTEIGLDGNIFNMPSLEQWCRIGVQRAFTSEQPTSPLLSEILLPKIHETI